MSEILSLGLNFLTEQQKEMEVFLETLVNTDSFSANVAGVCNVRDEVAQFLAQKNITFQKLEAEGKPAILAEVGDSGPVIALTGHMDTVFPTGEPQRRPFSQKNGIAHGPGVADMKAGVVMNCYILAAAKEMIDSGNELPFTLRLLLTGDEEIGSLSGRVLIRQYLADVAAVFNAEPGRVTGNVVTSRKGGASYHIEVTGKTAHAGVNHKDGISAIEALARIITKIHQLTDYEKGITTNVGVIQGGTTSNTIAGNASAELDVRFMTPADGKMLEEKLREAVANHGVSGAKAELIHEAGFLPLEEKMSAKVMAIYHQAALSLGGNIEGEFTGGCSDAGWTSAMGIPTLCATGPVGGKPHTDREYMELATLSKRAKIVLASCFSIAEKGL